MLSGELDEWQSGLGVLLSGTPSHTECVKEGNEVSAADLFRNSRVWDWGTKNVLPYLLTLRA